ncbi:carbon starvation protein [Synergistales bacterium]|nr:carbon starvation protein [Synergistales bacterium]
MTTFLIGLALLIAGGMVYGRVCENVMKPDNRKAPAYTRTDGVDYVPMKTWRNSLINLLNIAGTGPILGPVQGILFGPIAFILIPVGNVLGGAAHDYFSGMLAIRNEGMQMPALIRKYTNGAVYQIYNIFLCILMLLLGVVFIYTPGDIASTHIFGFSGASSAASTWVIYSAIFVYYIMATVFPIDKLIGAVYPLFGAVLLFSTAGVLGGLFTGGYQLPELSAETINQTHPFGQKLIPMFFITVACGIVSGFHSTQTAIISRSMTSEKCGRMTFYNMMTIEGFIAMIWAAGAIGAVSAGVVSEEMLFKNPAVVIGAVANHMLGNTAGLIAILGVIVLPVTSGDTALRSLRLMAADYIGLDQKPIKHRLAISIPIFLFVAAILVWAKMSYGGFNALWRYFAWSNQTIAIFAFAIITIYLIGKGHKIAPLMSLIPGTWYAFVTFSFICNASIGLSLPLEIAYAFGIAFALIYASLIIWKGFTLRRDQTPLEAVPIME